MERALQRYASERRSSSFVSRPRCSRSRSRHTSRRSVECTRNRHSFSRSNSSTPRRQRVQRSAERQLSHESQARSHTSDPNGRRQGRTDLNDQDKRSQRDPNEAPQVDAHQVTKDAEEPADGGVLEIEDAALQDDVNKYLGEDPAAENKNAYDLHPQVTTRWVHTLKQGLVKSVKEDIISKYPPPVNCTLLVAPQLNSEMVGILLPSATLRDKMLKKSQDQLGSGLSAIGKALNLCMQPTKLSTNEGKASMFEHVSDAGKILTDLFYHMSRTRRQAVAPALSKSVKDAVLKNDPDELLFGQNLGEIIKNAKSAEKVSRDLQDPPSQAVFQPAKKSTYTPAPRATAREAPAKQWRGKNFRSPARQTRQTKPYGHSSYTQRKGHRK